MHVHAGAGTRTYTQEKSQNDTFSSFNWHQISKFHQKKKIKFWEIFHWVPPPLDIKANLTPLWAKFQDSIYVQHLIWWYYWNSISFHTADGGWGKEISINPHSKALYSYSLCQMPNLHIYKITSTGKIFTWKMECSQSWSVK